MKKASDLKTIPGIGVNAKNKAFQSDLAHAVGGIPF